MIQAASDGLLSPAEQAALCWAEPPRSVRSARWSATDLVLIDEVAGLIERPGSFGHVVVDEAQDLSPMQCRVLARRSDFGSLTVLGDLTQGTTPWAARSWPEHLAHLGKPNATVAPLTTCFRVPAAIVAVANALLPHLATRVPPARSLRSDGELHVHSVADAMAGTVAAVRAARCAAGSIGVIAADAAVPEVRRVLVEAGIATAEPDPARRVTVLPASLAKGLEYDQVVAVEPAAIVAAEPRGLHRLYVVLTRAVSGLRIVHSRPLPQALGTLRARPGADPRAGQG